MHYNNHFKPTLNWQSQTPMLSILIPTYNFDCTKLVETLVKQLPEDTEIVVGDDMSTKPEIRSKLDSLTCIPKVRLIRPNKNLGSAGMRNLLCKEAKGDYLLYIDSDAIVYDNEFVGKYLQQKSNSVICGTIKHDLEKPEPNKMLRWKYEIASAHSYTVEKRNQNPYCHFRTSHFLIPKHIMLSVPFNESIKHSGYEDLLFGKELKEHGVNVLHVNIDAINGDIEDNDVFLKKTEGHMETLFQLQKELADYSTLLSKYRKIKSYHFQGIIKIVFKLTKKLLCRNLLGKNPSIKLFQFYKLGYYATIDTKCCSSI